MLSHIQAIISDKTNMQASIFHCVLVLKVHRLRQLLPLYSRRFFCSHGAALGTPVLHYNRCATPAKLPFLQVSCTIAICNAIFYKSELHIYSAT